MTEIATAFDFGNVSDAALLSDALDCVTYAISVPEGGRPRLEWSAGTIHGERPVPLQEILEVSIQFSLFTFEECLFRILNILK